MPQANTVNKFQNVGQSTQFDISFLGNFLEKEHVKAYLKDASTKQVTPLTFTWRGPFSITIPAPIPTGKILVIRRETPRDPMVDFTDGHRWTAEELDISARQGLFVAAEIEDEEDERLEDLTVPWAQVTDKPFTSIGQRLSVVDGVLSADVQAGTGTGTGTPVGYATADTAGIIKVGTSLVMNATTGVLNVAPGSGSGTGGSGVTVNPATITAGGVVTGPLNALTFAQDMATQTELNNLSAVYAKIDGSHGLYSGPHAFTSATVTMATAPVGSNNLLGANTNYVDRALTNISERALAPEIALVLNFNGPDGSAAIVDSSWVPKLVTATSSAYIKTSAAKFGGSGLFLCETPSTSANGGYISSQTHPDFTLNDTDWTFEMWFRGHLPPVALTNAVTSVVSPMMTLGASDWTITFMKTPTGAVLARLSARPTGVYGVEFITNLDISALFAGTYKHFAVSKSGKEVRMFIDGVLSQTQHMSWDAGMPGSGGFKFGNMYSSGGGDAWTYTDQTSDGPLNRTAQHAGLRAEVDDLRFTTKVARYLTDFTPPTEELDGYALYFSPKINKRGGDIMSGPHSYEMADLTAKTQNTNNNSKAVTNMETLQLALAGKANISGNNVTPNTSWPISVTGSAGSIAPANILAGGATSTNAGYVMTWNGEQWGPAAAGTGTGGTGAQATYTPTYADYEPNTQGVGGVIGRQVGYVELYDESLIALRRPKFINQGGDGTSSTAYGNAVVQLGLPTATASRKGGIKVGNGLAIDATTGVLSATGSGTSTYTLPTATASVLGGLKVGAGLYMDANTSVLSFNPTYAKYTATPTVTRVMGSVGLHDDSLVTEYVNTQDAAGNVVQVPYLGLPAATMQKLGGVRVEVGSEIRLGDSIGTVNGQTFANTLRFIPRFADYVTDGNGAAGENRYPGYVELFDNSLVMARRAKDTTEGRETTGTSFGNAVVQIGLPMASASTRGGIKVGNGLEMDAVTGVLSATGGSYSLPAATASALGGIKVDRTVSPFYVEATTNLLKTMPVYASYAAETPTSTVMRTLGDVGLMDGSLVLQEDTVTDPFGSPYKISYLGLPKASSSLLGGIKVGNGLNMNALTGVLSVQAGAGGTYTLPNASASDTGGIKLGRNVNWVNNPDGVDRVECLAPDVANEVAGVILPGANMVRNAQKPQKWDVNIPAADTGVAGIINPGAGFVQRIANGVTYYDALPPLTLDGNLAYSLTNTLQLAPTIDLLDTTKWNIRVATKVAGDATSYPASTAFVSDANQTTRTVLTNSMNNTLANYTLRSTDPAGAGQVMGGYFNFTAPGCVLHVRDSTGTDTGTELQVVNQNYVNIRHQSQANLITALEGSVNGKANKTNESGYKQNHDFTAATGTDACVVKVPTVTARGDHAASTYMVYDTVNLKPVRVLAAATVNVIAGNSYIIEANNVVMSVASDLTDVDKGIAFVMSTGYNGFQINWNGHKISGATQTNLMSIRSTGVKYRFIYRDPTNGYVKFS